LLGRASDVDTGATLTRDQPLRSHGRGSLGSLAFNSGRPKLGTTHPGLNDNTAVPRLPIRSVNGLCGRSCGNRDPSKLSRRSNDSADRLGVTHRRHGDRGSRPSPPSPRRFGGHSTCSATLHYQLANAGGFGHSWARNQSTYTLGDNGRRQTNPKVIVSYTESGPGNSGRSVSKPQFGPRATIQRSTTRRRLNGAATAGLPIQVNSGGARLITQCGAARQCHRPGNSSIERPSTWRSPPGPGNAVRQSTTETLELHPRKKSTTIPRLETSTYQVTERLSRRLSRTQRKASIIVFGTRARYSIGDARR